MTGDLSNRAEVNVSNLERHAELVEASRPLRQGRSTKRARCFDKLSMTTFLLRLLLLEYLMTDEAVEMLRQVQQDVLLQIYFCGMP